MKRSIFTQELAGKTLAVHAADERSPNGDNHAYAILGPHLDVPIQFQHGDPANGLNGVTLEALLAICADRLEGCQSGPWACTENEAALHSIKGALAALHCRVSRVAKEYAAPAAPDANAGMPEFLAQEAETVYTVAMGRYKGGEPARIGDVVRLASGGPELTVGNCIESGRLICSWSTEKPWIATDSFPTVCLTLIRRDPESAAPALDTAGAPKALGHYQGGAPVLQGDVVTFRDSVAHPLMSVKSARAGGWVKCEPMDASEDIGLAEYLPRDLVLIRRAHGAAAPATT